ncbi:hypothetical protein DPM18_01680 [Polynucleobacter paneuropaeus]|uniref:class I SAM-dependent methyltransferase n=1 Tax=Polynucleobacter paneuropaeus TaxID=2527775 RepID=UPI000DBF04EF|nr:class I SAM-dependent methyltransferase [Polynucleobacter paneuropaeus]AWW45635.1 hypothetical protein DPM18_01680 [Polynucleobacter paneuropaeus]
MSKICKFCLLKSASEYCRLSPKIFGGQYTIYVCKICGAGHTIPSPILSENHYEDDVRPEIITEKYSLEVKNSIVQIIERFAAIRGEAPTSLVDIGCGNGLILLEAMKLGLKVKGIEPSKGMSRAAAQKGVPVFNGYLEEFDDLGSYDIIMLNSVIEHIENPVDVLNKLHRCMSEKAVIIFQQAVYDGFVPKIIKKFWYGWSPSEHYWHFTADAFIRLLTRAKFEVVTMNRSNLYYQFVPLENLKSWKSFLFSNGCKLLSLSAAMFKNGDSASFYVTKSLNN